MGGTCCAEADAAPSVEPAVVAVVDQEPGIQLLGVEQNRDKRVKSLFENIDLDSNGFLDKTELLKFCIEGYDSEKAKQMQEQVVKFCDVNKDGKVTLDEWTLMFKNASEISGKESIELLEWYEDVAVTLTKKRIALIFKKIDINANGFLDKEELLRFCSKGLDMKIGAASLQAAGLSLQESCDTNSDGKVTLKEWESMFAKQAVRSNTTAARMVSMFEQLAASLMTERIESLFRSIDVDGNKTLNKAELIKFCKEGSVDRAGAERLVRKCDTDKDGKVTMDEWKAMFEKEATRSDIKMVEMVVWLTELAKALTDKRIEALFKKIDTDGGGHLDKEELRQFCDEAGNFKLQSEALQASLDADGDGKVTLKEWKAMFKKEHDKSDKDMNELLSWFEEVAIAINIKKNKERATIFVNASK